MNDDSIGLIAVAYNLVLLGLNAFSLLVVRRLKSPIACAVAVAVCLLGSVILGIYLGGISFAAIHLWCYGIFAQLPIVLVVSAIFLGRGRPFWACAALISALVVIGISIDAFLIEPHWLEVSQVTLESKKVSRPWRFVLIADLQTDQLGAYERNVFEQVKSAKPDLVFMAGDYLQSAVEQTEPLRQAYREFFREIALKASHGIFAVGGNTDAVGWEQMFTDTPITPISKTHTFDVDELRVIGLSLDDSFNPRLAIGPASQYQIVVGHGPDYALGEVAADLQLAGHTHGGQVRLPWIGPLITLSRVPRAWASGTTALDSDRTLIVSRGIGMERRLAPRLRFLCRPQLVIIDVKPARPIPTS